jgi:hypothetical protein
MYNYNYLIQSIHFSIYYSCDKIKNYDMVGERSMNGVKEWDIQGLVGNTPFGRPTGAWEDDIKNDFQEIGRQDIDLSSSG